PHRRHHPDGADREPRRRGVRAGLGLRRAGAVRLPGAQAALLTRPNRPAAPIRVLAGASCRAAQSRAGVGALAAATTARSSAAEATLDTTADTSGSPIT